VVTSWPSRQGALRVELALSGGMPSANMEPKITLDGSGRCLAYSRLQALRRRARTDGTLQVLQHIASRFREDAASVYRCARPPPFPMPTG